MDVFQNDSFIGLRIALLTLWVVLFSLGAVLIYSGFKVERKAIKLTTIGLGSTLMLVSAALFVYTFIFGVWFQ